MTSNVDPTETLAFLAEDRRGQLVGISIAGIVTTTIVLATRTYAKKFQGGGFFLDDAFLLAAYIVNLGMCALGIIMTEVGGVGRHTAFNQVAQPKALIGWAQCILAFEMIYFISVALPKLSIICLYLRIFNWKGALQNSARVLFVLTSMTSLSLVGAACFQCRPLAFWWDKTIKGGVCFDVQAFFHAQALPGAILDLAIMALPVSTIWQLKLPTIKRLALLGIFIIASFGIVASIIRATIFYSNDALEDRTWASVDLVGWSIIETSVYIITGCLPHLKPLVSRYTPAWLKSFVRSTIPTLKSGSGKKGAGSKYWSSKSGATTVKGSGRYKVDSVEEDGIELTSAEEGLHRTSTVRSTPERPRTLEIHPKQSSLASVAGGSAEPSPAMLTPGQIVVTKEVLMTRT